MCLFVRFEPYNFYTDDSMSIYIDGTWDEPKAKISSGIGILYNSTVIQSYLFIKPLCINILQICLRYMGVE